jgi:hypothetical protein
VFGEDFAVNAHRPSGTTSELIDPRFRGDFLGIWCTTE